MKSYQPGNAITIKEQVLNPDQTPPALVDTTSTKLTLVDPAGTVKVNNLDMTRLSTGRYIYVYQSGTSDVVGDWIATVTVVRTGNTNIKKYPVFRLTTDPIA